MEIRILVVDDDPGLCRQLEGLLGSQGYLVDSVNSGAQALQGLAEHSYSLVLVDLRMPDTDGLALMEEIHKHWPDVSMIMITGDGSIPNVVSAMRAGGDDFIKKPFRNEELLLAVERALQKRRILDEIHYLRGQLAERYALRGYDGVHLASFLDVARQAGPADTEFSSFGDRLNRAARRARRALGVR